MDSIIVGGVVFTVSFVGALFGLWLRTVLPEHHLDEETKDTVKLGIGLIATMTALVLGLVTASAKSSFDSMDAAVKQSAAQVLALDRLLARYGPETAELRRGLKQAIGARIDVVWPRDASAQVEIDPTRTGLVTLNEGLVDAELRTLKPRDDVQRTLLTRAIDASEALLAAQWGSSTHSGASIPLPFLVILLFWLSITFTSFGLFAPRNPLVITVLFVCAISVASAVFLVLELDGPFDGIIKVSSEPMLFAQRHLNL